MTINDETPMQIRPLDPRRDLLAVADLIEECFAAGMDADGKEYLRQLRRTAHEVQVMRLSSHAIENLSMPLSGYVWEENGRIVGNLSLIPLRKEYQRVYLIANVAVTSEYRQRGIAKALTLCALDYVRQRGAPAAWLQVRDDNPVAKHLYNELGFHQRASRTTWQSMPAMPEERETEVRVVSRQRSHWDQQLIWLEETYPPQVRWNMPFAPRDFKPGLFKELMDFLNGFNYRHWSALKDDRLIGTTSWTPARGYADNLWLGVDLRFEQEAVSALLTRARHQLIPRRPLWVNYPAGRAIEAFVAAGFTQHITLDWMEHRLNS